MIFVVAEIGVNWDGNLDLVREMIMNAKKAGCNAVKFQSFDEELIKEHPERSRLIKTSISKTNIESINEFAKSADIEWFCTPMYPQAVELLEPYVNRYKIRVIDGKPLLENKTSVLLDKVLATNKEMIVSSQINPKGTRFFNNSQIKWLYCVPKYPCDFTDLDFVNMKDFDGYSNHCPHFLAPLTAAILGGKIIEIHITSDKSKNFFDNNVSFDYDELNQLITNIRLVEKIKK